MADIDWKSDLLLGVMNLIEKEHHARWSWRATGDIKYLHKVSKCAEKRAKYMKLLEVEKPTQDHCYNKHGLSAGFRFIEVGDKLFRIKRFEDAIECYNDGFEEIEEFVEDNLEQLQKEEVEGIIGNIKKKWFGGK